MTRCGCSAPLIHGVWACRGKVFGTFPTVSPPCWRGREGLNGRSPAGRSCMPGHRLFACNCNLSCIHCCSPRRSTFRLSSGTPCLARRTCGRTRGNWLSCSLGCWCILLNTPTAHTSGLSHCSLQRHWRWEEPQQQQHTRLEDSSAPWSPKATDSPAFKGRTQQSSNKGQQLSSTRELLYLALGSSSTR